MTILIVLAVAYLVVGLIFAFFMMVSSPGGWNNNAGFRYWTLSDWGFMLFLVVAYPYFMFHFFRKQ